VAQLAVNLITALTWPVVIILLLIYFGGDLREFVKNTNELRLKVPGIEGTLIRPLQSAAALGAAAERQRVGGGGSANSGMGEAELRGIADTVQGAIQSKSAKRIPGSSLIWVDDRPQNNVYERKSLEALGIRVTISESTEDALEKVQSNRYDAIISDMGRPPDSQAGYTLLAELRKRKIDTPHHLCGV